ncbi:MAG: threonylcarbamoyl-AMP synthase [Bdellovibrionales bacterium]|nr:threonylcarbamoyl-AMP synthase [Bdellovibrionales bacterium]
MILEVHVPTPAQRVIDQAVAVLQRGGIIAFPTDSGYALGCDLYNKKAIDRIIAAKQRDPKKPLSFICADLKELSQFAVVSDKAYRDMRRLLPGPYTFVLPATKMVPRLLISRRSSVGIRIPGHVVPQTIVVGLKHPIIGTSCTDSDGEPLSTAQEIQKRLGKRVDLILDGGPISSEPSTVIDFTAPEPVIIRVGKGDVSSFAIKDGQGA